MSDSAIWDEAPPYGLIRKGLLASGVECLPGCFEPLAYMDNSSMLGHPSRPALHIDTAILQWSAVELCADDGDSQRRQLGYIHSFRHGVPGSEESPPATRFFNVPAATLLDASSPAYSQPPSTPTSYAGSCILSPRPSRHPSFSSTRSFSQSPRPFLEDMAAGSPTLESDSPDERRHGPTIVDRFGALSPISQRLFRTCGSVPQVQSAVLDILESPELRARVAIKPAMAEPLLEKVNYTEATDGKGKRGAPQFYKCRWGTCGDKISRKLHAVEHIMTHADNRSHICDHCGKGFVRKNELKKHTPCKALKRKLKCIGQEFVPSPPETLSSGTTADPRNQDFSDFQVSHPMPLPISPSFYSEEPTYPPAYAASTPPAPFAALNTKHSAVDIWETQADFQETGYFSYSQPVRVTTAC